MINVVLKSLAVTGSLVTNLLIFAMSNPTANAQSDKLNQNDIPKNKVQELTKIEGMDDKNPNKPENSDEIHGTLSENDLDEGIFSYGAYLTKVSVEWFSGPKPEFAIIINPRASVPSWDYRTLARTIALNKGAAYIIRNSSNNPALPNNLAKPFEIARYLRAGAPGMNGLPSVIAEQHEAGIPTFLIGFGLGGHALVGARELVRHGTISGIILYGANMSIWTDPNFGTSTTFVYGQLDKQQRVVSKDDVRYKFLEIPMLNNSCMTSNVQVKTVSKFLKIEQESPLNTTQCSSQLLTTLKKNKVIWTINQKSPSNSEEQKKISVNTGKGKSKGNENSSLSPEPIKQPLLENLENLKSI